MTLQSLNLLATHAACMLVDSTRRASEKFRAAKPPLPIPPIQDQFVSVTFLALAWQPLVRDLSTISCGVLLFETFSVSPNCAHCSTSVLRHSTAPQRWTASADSNHCACSWPHAKPASQPRQLLLLQHSPRMWRLSWPCSLQMSCFPLVLNRNKQLSHCCSH